MKSFGKVLYLKYSPVPIISIAIAFFYYWTNQNVDAKRKFLQQLQTSADFVVSKYPSAGLFLVCNPNELTMNSICSSLKVRQIVKIPTTRGNSSLDVMLTI